jgi:hypothetical protein
MAEQANRWMLSCAVLDIHAGVKACVLKHTLVKPPFNLVGVG